MFISKGMWNEIDAVLKILRLYLQRKDSNKNGYCIMPDVM